MHIVSNSLRNPKNSDGQILDVGLRGYEKFAFFSTEITMYLGHGKSQARGYYGSS